MRTATRRRQRRQAERAQPEPRFARQRPWRNLKSPFPPLEILSEDQLEAVHEASMRLVEQQGIEVMSERARRFFAEAGAEVDGARDIVRLDRALLMELVARAPSRFTLTPRNPDHAITLGGNHINFGLVSGPPNVHDRIEGRRPGNFKDYCQLVKLAQSFNIIHFLGNQVVAPIELPVNNRHLDTYRANLVLTDKVFNCVSIGAGRTRDAVEMTALARGLSLEEMAENPASITNININSPRKLDDAMAEGAMQMAELGQAVIVTPFTLMGAMTPVTFAAALAQQNAEALVGIALTQLVRAGAPVVYGGFTSNVDMRSGAPAFGTPENCRANIAGGQLARRYGLPYRTSACNASNTTDAQAVYESEFALWGGVMGHGNLVYHAAGWLEGGLIASYEKLIIDVESLQAMAEVMAPVEVSEAEFGLEAIEQVGPGGHFFGSPHTMERYKTAFYEPLLSDWQNHENWLLAGGKDAAERATEIWQEVLEAYEAPPIEAGRLEAIDAYIEKRKEAIGEGEP
jgi:trimethylamine--corrinoid protein Co-methyltransferase